MAASVTAGALVVGLAGWGLVSLANRVATVAAHGFAHDGGSADGGSDPDGIQVPDDATGHVGGPAYAPATSPLVCADACLSAAALEHVLHPRAADLTALGTPTSSGDDVIASTPQDDWSNTEQSWDDDGGSDPACEFAYAPSPVVTMPTADDGVTALLPQYTGDDEYPVLSESLRVFPDSAAAEQYMTTLRDAVTGCTGYHTDDGDWDATLTPLSGWTGMPADVGVTGWVEDAGSDGRFYDVDLQRGNSVVRITLTIDDDSGDAVRRFAWSTATELTRAATGAPDGTGGATAAPNA